MEKGQAVRENRCKWCHDSHDEALSLHCLCCSHRISEQRLNKAILLRSFPTAKETILDHTYKHASSSNPIGTMQFMAMGEQEFLAKRDVEEARLMVLNQKRLGRHTALKLIKKLKMIGLQKSFTVWKHNAKFQRAIATVFNEFDTDKSGKLDLTEVLKAVNSLGASLSLSKVANLIKTLSGGGSEINVDQFQGMIYLMDDDSKPDLQAMIIKMKKQIDISVEGIDRRNELFRLKHGVEAKDTDKKNLIEPAKNEAKLLKMVNKPRRDARSPPSPAPSHNRQHSCIPPGAELR